MYFNEWINFGRQNKNYWGLREAIKRNNGGVPIIVHEYNADGTVYNFQEGRTRAIAAFDEVLRVIPVMIAKWKR